MKRYFLTILIILGVLQVNAQLYKWQSVRISGGGNVTSIVFHPLVKDVAYITTDVGTPWRWNAKAQQWDDMMLGSKIPVKYWRPTLSQAALAVAVDPNDKTGNIVYAMVENGDPATFQTGMGHGGVLKSYDRGKSWTDCWLPITVLPNDNGEKSFTNRMMVDPANSNIIYVLSLKHGTWINEKAGAKGHWRKVNTTLPDKNYRINNNGDTLFVASARFILFDKSSGKINNRTKVVYLGYKDGVLKSTDGGRKFKHMSGSPATIIQGTIANNGMLYVSYNATMGKSGIPHQSGIVKWNKKQWLNVTPEAPKLNGQYFRAVAVNPFNANEIVFTQSGTWNRDKFFRSRNSGATWQSPPLKIDNTEAPHSGTGKPAYNNNALAWDTFRPGHVWYSDMIDVGHTKNVWADTITWKLEDKGLEEVIVTGPLVAPPFGKNLLHSSTADIGGADHRSLTGILPHGMTHFFFGENITLGTNVVHTAVQYTNPNFVVRIGSNGWSQLDTVDGRAGYSLDGGDSYQRFPTYPGVRGRIAVAADSQKIVWVTQANDANSGEVFWSHNLGKTWTKANGTPAGIIPFGSQWNIPAGSNCIAADKVDGNTFYIFDRGKLYISTDGGKNFGVANATLPNWGTNPKNNSAYATYANIETTPGKQGDIWIAFEGNTNGGLYHSTDGGKNFTKVNPDVIKNPKWIAIGKDKPNGKVLLYTTSTNVPINGVQYGIFRSADWGKTWETIANPAPGIVMNLAADEQGRVFAGINGVGIFYGEKSDVRR